MLTSSPIIRSKHFLVGMWKKPDSDYARDSDTCLPFQKRSLLCLYFVADFHKHVQSDCESPNSAIRKDTELKSSNETIGKKISNII